MKENSIRACVNRIILNTFIDGPGSRMAVFLQGCNMKCLYCHNPETQEYCSSCGKCAEACPEGALTVTDGRMRHDEALCKGCDFCLKVCPSFSTPRTAEMDVEELYGAILSYVDFLDGITISGGECTLQHEFVYALFDRVRKNTSLTCFIDTNGTMPHEVTEKLCAVADGFMLDMKAVDKRRHIALTGMDNERILENIRYISGKGLLYEVRTVIVEGFTDSPEDIESIAHFMAELNDYSLWKLIPFRPLGVKSHMASMEPIDNEKFEELFGIAKDILKERAIRSL